MARTETRRPQPSADKSNAIIHTIIGALVTTRFKLWLMLRICCSLLFFLLAVMYTSHAFSTPSTTKPWPSVLKHENGPYYFAHRGGYARAPQNTIEAFTNAKKYNADVLELDVHLTLDGHIVVFHDDYVNETTNGDGLITSMTLAELRELDMGYFHQHVDAAPDAYPFRNQGIQISTLAEIFARFPTDIVNIEIKDDSLLAAEALAKTVIDSGATKRVIVVSEYAPVLTHFRKLCPEALTAAPEPEILSFCAYTLLGLWRWIKVDSNAFEFPVFRYISLIRQDLLETAHAINHPVIFFTINEESQMKELLEFGADGFMGDFPDRAQNVINHYKTSPKNFGTLRGEGPFDPVYMFGVKMPAIVPAVACLMVGILFIINDFPSFGFFGVAGAAAPVPKKYKKKIL